MSRSGSAWSYPDIGGTVAVVANQAGVKQGATFGYDPGGNRLGTPVDNAAGKFDYGWHGKVNGGVGLADSLGGGATWNGSRARRGTTTFNLGSVSVGPVGLSAQTTKGRRWYHGWEKTY